MAAGQLGLLLGLVRTQFERIVFNEFGTGLGPGLPGRCVVLGVLGVSLK